MARFRRKNKDASGSYNAAYREKTDGSVEHIKIEGRGIYETDDKRKIEFLSNDPEIEEVNKKTKIEGEE